MPSRVLQRLHGARPLERLAAVLCASILGLPSSALGAELSGEVAFGYLDEDLGDHVAPMDLFTFHPTYFARQEARLQLAGDAAVGVLAGGLSLGAGLRGLTRFDAHPHQKWPTYWDTGTYLRLAWLLRPAGASSLSLTLFPFDAEPLRLGHLYPASVDQFRNAPRDSWLGAPGARLALESPSFGLFAGFKALEGPGHSGEVHWALLGGASKSFLGGRLQLEAQAGYYRDGAILDYERLSSTGETHHSLGFSSRIIFRRGLPVGDPLDSALQRRNPNGLLLAMRRPSWPWHEVGYLFSVEGVGIMRHAHLTGESRQEVVGLGAFAAQGRIGLSHWLMESTLLWANAPFLVYSIPELAQSSAWLRLPDQDQRGQLLWLASVERTFARARLTPGLSLGLELPAAARLNLFASFPGGPTSAVAKQVLVFRETGEVSLLGEDQTRGLIFRMRAQLRWDWSHVSVLGWLAYSRDPNTYTVLSPLLTRVAMAGGRNQYGAGVALSLSSD